MSAENKEVEGLIKLAEDYANLAGNFFLLTEMPPRRDEINPPDKVPSELLDYVAAWASGNRITFTSLNNRLKMMVHFLFPKLSTEERYTIESLAFATIRLNLPRGGNDEELHRQYVALRDEMAALHSKLTQPQLDILETKKFRFDPPLT